MGKWKRWQPGECAICIAHRHHGIIWPPPRMVFWKQCGLAPVRIDDWPDPADVYEDERERWSDPPYDEWHDLERAGWHKPNRRLPKRWNPYKHKRRRAG